MDGDIFENAPRVDVDIFYTDKKDAFSKISGYVWTGPDIHSSRTAVILTVSDIDSFRCFIKIIF